MTVPHWVRMLALALFAMSTLTACTVSLSGGLAGGFFALALLIFASFSQSGCIEDAPTPDDAGLDAGLMDIDAGPCLSLLDAAVDAQISPQPDVNFGPCLSPPPEDMYPDAQIGPCLGAPQPDMNPVDGSAQALPSALNRDALLAKMVDGLPADVVARLRGDDV